MSKKKKKGGFLNKIFSIICIFVLIGIIADFNKNRGSSSTTSEIKSTTLEEVANSNEDESSEATENDYDNKYELTSQQLSDVNDYIIASLEEDQGFALGKLDENGNPTENGTPDEDYSYSLFINSLSFEENGVLVAQVNPDFMNLSEDMRTEIGNILQGKAQTALLLKADIDPMEIGSTFLSFRNGAKILGHSKMTNASEFTWNE